MTIGANELAAQHVRSVLQNIITENSHHLNHHLQTTKEIECFDLNGNKFCHNQTSEVFGRNYEQHDHCLQQLKQLSHDFNIDITTIRSIFTRSEHVRAALGFHPSFLVHQNIRSNSALLELALQAIIQICNPVILEIEFDARPNNITSTSHRGNMVNIEASILKHLLLRNLRILLATCKEYKDCALDYHHNCGGSAIRGLFLHAYQNMNTRSSTTNQLGETGPILEQHWELPKVFFQLCQVIIPRRENYLNDNNNVSELSNDHPHSHSHMIPVTESIVEQAVENVHESSSSKLTVVPSDKSNFRNRRKVGFLSAYFSRHSVGRLLASVIIGLNRDVFDVHVIRVTAGGHHREDDITHAIKDANQTNWHRLSVLSIELAIQQIIALQLDIIVWGDIFMDSFTTRLAQYRLANTQVLFWGHPFSSGLKNVDYFISSIYFEANVIQREKQRYREQLVLFETLSTSIYHSVEQENQEKMKSTDKFLSKQNMLQHITDSFVHKHPLPRNWKNIYGGNNLLWDDHKKEINGTQHLRCHSNEWKLFGCLQSLMKLHPSFDRIVAEILLREPCAVIFFLSNPKQPISQQLFQHRLLRSIDKWIIETYSVDHIHKDLYNTATYVKSRIIFVHQMATTSEYLNLVCSMDVTLDLFPFGGGVTLSDSILCGIAFITSGQLQTVHRIGAGFASVMNLTELIAENEEEYIQKALRLSTSSIETFNTNDATIQWKLKNNSFFIFHNNKVIEEWETFLNRI